jgi:EmrB/QacA subfamily drug resistance transporter
MPHETNRFATVAALLLALFMAAMEMTVVSTAMPTVVADLGGAGHYAWVFTAYMLTSTVTVPIYGKLADLYGRKPVMLASMALFLVGSMASGQARTMAQLVVFRGVQGVGAGGMQPMALTIVGDIFAIEERGKMQGLFGAVWAIAGLVGPLLGGLIVGALSWRWIFYVNVPFGLLSAGLLTFALVEKIEKREHTLDVLGAALMAGAVVALLLASDGTLPIAVLGVSAVLLTAFVVVERRAKEPVLSLALLSRRVLAISSALSALSGAAMLGIVTFVPLYVQGVLGASPTAAGAAIAPLAIGWPVASAISGRLLPKVGFRPLVRLGGVVVALSATALALLVSRGAGDGAIRFAAGAVGIGMGLSNTAIVIAVQSSVAFAERGVATASTMFFRNIGGTVAVGGMGVLLAHALERGAGIPGGVDDVVSRVLGPARRSVPAEVLRAVSEHLALGVTHVLWTVAVLAGIAAVVAMAFPAVAMARSVAPPAPVPDPEPTAASKA